MVLKNHNIVIPINRQEANLPIVYDYYVTSAKNKHHWPLLISGVVFIILGSLGFFGGLIIDTYSRGTEVEVVLTDKFENSS